MLHLRKSTLFLSVRELERSPDGIHPTRSDSNTQNMCISLQFMNSIQHGLTNTSCKGSAGHHQAINRDCKRYVHFLQMGRKVARRRRTEPSQHVDVHGRVDARARRATYNHKQIRAALHLYFCNLHGNCACTCKWVVSGARTRAPLQALQLREQR
jgi:hypothetical protein